MKYGCLFLLACFIYCDSKAQLTTPQKNLIFRPARPDNDPLVIDCIALSNAGICNYFRNNNFTPSSNYNPDPSSATGGYSDAFYGGFIPEWYAGQGSPIINDYIGFSTGVSVTPPPPATGYAFMAVEYQDVVNLSEGIVQKIPATEAAKSYCLSFFIKASSTQAPPSPTKFRVILMSCADYGLITAGSTGSSPALTPPIPANSQVVYCNTSFNTLSNWEQKVVTFNATGNRDLVWIFPEGAASPTPAGAVDFAYPELIKLENFNAGASPTPYLPSCLVTLGPNVPNCGVANAIFQWKSPTGSITTAPASQQIVVDASISTNRGTWTLSMLPPAGIDNANNICSSTPAIISSATVNVPACTAAPCIVLPLIQ